MIVELFEIKFSTMIITQQISMLPAKQKSYIKWQQNPPKKTEIGHVTD
jgi:hypothetical protein